MLDVAERRGLEGTPIHRVLGDAEATEIGVRCIDADTDVGVHVRGEIAAFVAGITLRLFEHTEATNGRG